jgi:D-xylose transport system permease protein
MSDLGQAAGRLPERRGLADTLELDKRLFGMLVAFALLCAGFYYQTGGTFLSPRNIFNISVQTVAVGSWRRAWSS